MHIAVNALAATRGGAVTVLPPFLSSLRELEPQWRFTVYLSNPNLNLFLDGVNTAVVETGGWRRGWMELIALDRRARRDGATMMLNVLNSGSLLPQLISITWQRNGLYFDRRWLKEQRRRAQVEAWLRRNVALLACRASAVTVAPSETMARYLQDWPLGRSLRVEVVPHGVDMDRFAITQDRPHDGSFIIGVMGHAASHRGLAKAVHVLAEVRRRGVRAKLLLTVPRHGNAAFQSTIDDVARVSELLGIRDHVVFGGDANSPAAWYRTIDLLMIPSDCESFCLPLLEGISSGLPVVTSGLPALREIGGDLALHGSTIHEMASHVLELHGESEDRMHRRHQLARSRAEAFSWGETARRVRALVLEVRDSGCR